MTTPNIQVLVQGLSDLELQSELDRRSLERKSEEERRAALADIARQEAIRVKEAEAQLARDLAYQTVYPLCEKLKGLSKPFKK